MNAVSVRSYNERLVLSLLLQSKGLSRMEIGKRTGLSAQTISVIVRSLEQEGLVAKGEAQKGRMGPPTIPLSLNPDGAYAVGVSLGHRHIDVALLDFVGDVKFFATLDIPPQKPGQNESDLIDAVRAAIGALPSNASTRLAGVGLAIPEDREELALVPEGLTERFESIGKEIETALGVEVYVQNDITAAAAGESMFGAAKSLDDYLFFYLGARLHHRLILNHQIFQSPSQTSSQIGLLDLEARLRNDGRHPLDALWARQAEWPDFGEVAESWVDDCIGELSRSISSASQFLPVNTVIVSSYAPGEICEKIASELGMKHSGIDARAGALRASPKAMGAACLPFSSKFTVS
ncbi:ROK family transcriptional regulator [Ruegeria jejuensis]|uniref:ROK family transcriptional regulator n=1 Tax=Ruegeria jejuensis TaxID=3233338 RepID=UPI00355B42D2